MWCECSLWKKKSNISIWNGKCFLVVKLAFPQYSSTGIFKVLSEMVLAPEALCEVRPHLCSVTLETEALKYPVQVLKPAGAQQSRAWLPPGAAHPPLCVTLSQHHCHLSVCRNVSVLSSTLKYGKPSYTTVLSVELVPFPEDLYQYIYKEQTSNRNFYK